MIYENAGAVKGLKVSSGWTSWKQASFVHNGKLIFFNMHEGYNLFQGNNPDSKVRGANIRLIWGRQDPGGPHVGPMNIDVWEGYH